jgi:ribosomal protein S18 acetylase RimI-like enzyme
MVGVRRTVRDLLHEDVDALQELLESVPSYAERLTGYPPGPSDALSALIAVPPQFEPVNKRGLGMWDEQELVGFADVLIGHPQSDTAYIGLLIVHGGRHREGIGRDLHEAVRVQLRSHVNIERMRLGLVETVASEAMPFVRAMGYTETGERNPYRYDHVESTVTMWERFVNRS